MVHDKGTDRNEDSAGSSGSENGDESKRPKRLASIKAKENIKRISLAGKRVPKSPKTKQVDKEMKTREFEELVQAMLPDNKKADKDPNGHLNLEPKWIVTPIGLRKPDDSGLGASFMTSGQTGGRENLVTKSKQSSSEEMSKRAFKELVRAMLPNNEDKEDIVRQLSHQGGVLVSTKVSPKTIRHSENEANTRIVISDETTEVLRWVPKVEKFTAASGIAAISNSRHD